MIAPQVHAFVDLECLRCGASFKADPDRRAKEDGVGTIDRYCYSAIAAIAIMKYFLCMPLYRSQMKGSCFGTEIPRSTQQDQIEKLANATEPIRKEILRVAAEANLYHADDTTGVILTKPNEIKKQRKTGKEVFRDGRHTSVIIAIDDEERPMVLAKTGIIHSGEYLDEILSQRTSTCLPQIMWDRVSANFVTVCDYIDIGCLQHAREKFRALIDEDPKFVKELLALFKVIFKQDAKTKDMSDSDRLASHQEFSKSSFFEIKEICATTINKKKYSENSSLHKACKYFLNHEKSLSGFFHFPGAPLSNNLAERTIGNLVLLRNVVHHFKNEMGSFLADSMWTVGTTAYYNNVNLFEYFKLILAHEEEVKTNPAAWLPWNVTQAYPQCQLPEGQCFDRDRPAKQR